MIRQKGLKWQVYNYLYIHEFIKYLEKYNLSFAQKYELVAFLLNISYEEAKGINTNIDINNDDIRNIFNRLDNHEPISYITGIREFYGREFIVTRDTLIPRIETEILIENVLKSVSKNKEYKILDLCSGSGCIGLTLALELPKSTVTMVDISDKAIDVSIKNSSRLKTENVSFINSDIINYVAEKPFDIVVCNPPYITEEEYNTLDKSILFEPKLALVAKDNGLFFYKNILSKIEKLCKNSGIVFFEIGYNQKTLLYDYLKAYNFRYEFIKDYSNHDRVVKINV